jgi:hypothetical protein
MLGHQQRLKTAQGARVEVDEEVSKGEQTQGYEAGPLSG